MIGNNTNPSKPLAELMGSPDYYPTQLSVPERRIEIVHMCIDSYRKSPFLDNRIITHNDKSYALRFDDIPEISAKYHQHHAHYIFHNAFSSSTVLTRYLDMLAGAFILREPNILYEVATLKRFENTSTGIRLKGIAWEDLYYFIRLMIGRRYDHARPTIIKPTDGCNSLMGSLVGNMPENRGLFIYTTLEKFLVSVLRIKQRHDWVKIRAQELLLDKYNETGSLMLDPVSLSVPQAAALVWLLHTEQYIRNSRTENGYRFKSLNARLLATMPADCLVELCKHFHLCYEEDEIRQAAINTRIDLDSKVSNKTFDPEQRRKAYEDTCARYGHEIK